MKALVLERITERELIYRIMNCCKESVFNQSFSNNIVIKGLANKFAAFSEFIAIKIDGFYVGYIAFYCNDIEKKQAYLSMIIIHKSFQHLGLGKLLMDYMLSFVRLQNFISVKLEVNIENDYAIRFYKKYGFKEVSTNSSSHYLQLNFE